MFLWVLHPPKVSPCRYYWSFLLGAVAMATGKWKLCQFPRTASLVGGSVLAEVSFFWAAVCKRKSWRTKGVEDTDQTSASCLIYRWGYCEFHSQSFQLRWACSWLTLPANYVLFLLSFTPVKWNQGFYFPKESLMQLLLCLKRVKAICHWLSPHDICIIQRNIAVLGDQCFGWDSVTSSKCAIKLI